MSRIIRAIVFDMDGVIVDTEPLSQRRMLRYLRQYNDALTEADTSILVGRGRRDAWEIIARLSGTGRDAKDLQAEFHRDWLPVHDEPVDYRTVFRPAVKKVLMCAQACRLKTAVASSTEYRKVKTILTEVGIFSLLDSVISGEDCARPKPHPDVYLETARRLGVLPEECLVIEDSTVGIEAAHRAGTTVAALIDERFPFDREKANGELASIDDILPHLSVNPENGDSWLDGFD